MFRPGTRLASIPIDDEERADAIEMGKEPLGAMTPGTRSEAFEAYKRIKRQNRARAAEAVLAVAADAAAVDAPITPPDKPPSLNALVRTRELLPWCLARDALCYNVIDAMRHLARVPNFGQVHVALAHSSDAATSSVVTLQRVETLRMPLQRLAALLYVCAVERPACAIDASQLTHDWLCDMRANLSEQEHALARFLHSPDDDIADAAQIRAYALSDDRIEYLRPTSVAAHDSNMRDVCFAALRATRAAADQVQVIDDNDEFSRWFYKQCLWPLFSQGDGILVLVAHRRRTAAFDASARSLHHQWRPFRSFMYNVVLHLLCPSRTYAPTQYAASPLCVRIALSHLLPR